MTSSPRRNPHAPPNPNHTMRRDMCVTARAGPPQLRFGRRRGARCAAIGVARPFPQPQLQRDPPYPAAAESSPHAPPREERYEER